jgi:hypothetical protein
MTSYAPCPKCHSANAEKVKFSWWGGVLGPKMLTHVKCGNCGYKYNGKSGRDNTLGVVIYTMVVAGLGFIIFFVIALFLVYMSFNK